jgi:asparagine synthase (glutamine-hydrolysing)
MCGLAGMFERDGAPASGSVLHAMNQAIAHRGPDGEGEYLDGPIALGHRRLAIIDLSPAARQPMATADGHYVISYNGEVYNFRELRARLQALGHRFHSRSDTEVVLAAWAEWGVDCLKQFNGMFALAVWDRREQALFLARDRYGIKPLYWTLQGSTLLFGSEVKALLASRRVGRAVDALALHEYMTFQNFFSDRTLFAGIALLPPATWMRFDRGHVPPVAVHYWDFAFEEPTGPVPDEAEYREELDRLFRQAVGRQLVSDVEVGAYLSGGIDSGAVTAIAARELPDLRSFTVGFDLHSASGLEMGMDERREAERMSYLFRTEHYEMVLKAGDMERCMPRVVRHLEEPRVGQSYPNYYAAQLASKFTKVVLSGTGGDELFGGYPWRYYRAVVNADFDEYVDKYYGFWQRLVPNGAMGNLFQPLANEVGDQNGRDLFRSVFDHHAYRLNRPEDYVNHSLYLEAKTFLHGLLVVEDKLSMAHGLENRVPFLDNDLVDFSMRLPVAMKLGNLGEVVRLNENDPGAKASLYFQRTRDGKRLLRKVTERYIPAAVSDGEKKGFSAPDASWFRGESIDYVRRRLYDPHARIYDYLDRKTAHGLLDEHLEGRENRRLLVWSLLYLTQWLEEFIP